MKVCPSCGNTYPDDANFCPMDATRLPAAMAAPPSEAPSAHAPSVTVPDHPAPIAGRFAMAGSGAPTPTGIAGEAADLTTGAPVMVKLVPSEVLPTPAMADRALRELKQLGKVTSERIVRVVDQGRLPDGRIYVATERIDGAYTLEEIVEREGPLPIERARTIVLQVGEALTEAQKVGVIHRDVSPRNVLVAPGDRVKVADFGLAEPVSPRVFGSASFLSPEQAEGKPVDQRSNIYSLGAMYYYALTGRPPFVGDPSSLLQQHLGAIPPPPSTQRQGLGADVDRVILKALEKSGGRRHLTLRQLLTEVAATGAAAVQQPQRAGAEAKTMMGEAPVLPVAPVVPQRAAPQQQTMMGLPSPVMAMGPPAPKPAPAPAPSQTPQGLPQAMPRATPQAPTMMGEAPSLPVTKPNPMTAQPPPQAMPQAPPPAMPQAPPPAPTLMAEAPSPMAAAKPGNQEAAKGGGAFRETAWFKRGEIEEEMAKAQAAAGENALKTGTTGKQVPIDESQVDLSAQDRARLSLKTGATQTMPAVRGPQHALPGDRMDEAEMLAELNPSRKYFLIAGAVVLAVILGLVLYFTTRASPHAEAPPPEKPAPVAAAPPAATPTPTPPPPTTPPPTPAATPPTATPPPPAPPTPPAAAGSPSRYADAVIKLEASGGADRAELRRVEKSLVGELKLAHKRKNRALEETDRELLARVKRLKKK
jgi:eukaryotic-like serine/threonine-protein kinase